MGFREREIYFKGELIDRCELPNRSEELVFRMRIGLGIRGKYALQNLEQFEEVIEIERRHSKMLNSSIPYHISPFFPEGLYAKLHERYPINKPVPVDEWEAQCGVWLESHDDVDEAREIIEKHFLLGISEEDGAKKEYAFRVRSDGAVLAVSDGVPKVIGQIPEKIMGKYQLVKEIPGLEKEAKLT